MHRQSSNAQVPTLYLRNCNFIINKFKDFILEFRKWTDNMGEKWTDLNSAIQRRKCFWHCISENWYKKFALVRRIVYIIENKSVTSRYGFSCSFYFNHDWMWFRKKLRSILLYNILLSDESLYLQSDCFRWAKCKTESSIDSFFVLLKMLTFDTRKWNVDFEM